MRILAITPEYPSPPRSGGSIMTFHHLRTLAQRHTITLVCMSDPGERDTFADSLHAVEFVHPRRSPRLVTLGRCVINLLRGIPVPVTLARSPEMTERASQLLASGAFEAVVIYHMVALQYCPADWQRHAVLNLEDPQSLKLYRMARLPVFSRLKQIKLRIYGSITDRYERRHLGGFGRATLLSEADVLDLEAAGPYGNIAHVPYAQDPAGVLPFAERTPGMLVFSGNMFHPPNVDGIVYFLGEVYARVLEQTPNACLWIVGAQPDERIRAAAQPFGDRVQITGKVPEVSDHVRRALVSICPVRLKIGTQTKILEAFSLGTPVVTTPEGNSGTRAVDGEHLWVESTPQGFATRVANVLRGDDWDRISANGRRFLTDRFSWEASASRLEALLRSVAR